MNVFFRDGVRTEDPWVGFSVENKKEGSYAGFNFST